MVYYRTYKNGITGHRHKGYYIVRNFDENNHRTYGVLDENKKVITEGRETYWECEWMIDKMTLTPEKEEIVKSLYLEELPVLFNYMVRLSQIKDERKLKPNEKEMLYWVEKIVSRKKKNQPF